MMNSITNGNATLGNAGHMCVIVRLMAVARKKWTRDAKDAKRSIVRTILDFLDTVQLAAAKKKKLCET